MCISVYFAFTKSIQNFRNGLKNVWKKHKCWPTNKVLKLSLRTYSSYTQSISPKFFFAQIICVYFLFFFAFGWPADFCSSLDWVKNQVASVCWLSEWVAIVVVIIIIIVYYYYYYWWVPFIGISSRRCCFCGASAARRKKCGPTEQKYK